MSDRNKTSTNLTNKIRSSLVIKLNLGMLLRLFSAFLSINILILFIVFGISLWKVEEGTQDIINIIENTPSNLELIEHTNNYRLIEGEELARGLTIPLSIEERLPVKIKGAKRAIDIPREEGLRLLERIDLVKYIIGFSMDGKSYQLVYSLGPNIKVLLILFAIIIFFELLILIGNIGKGSRMIRKTLKPIEELSERAKSLNREVSSLRQGAYIKDLTGAISEIDANKLDSRISVDSSQSELKDLAAAINQMLNRINAAYQSQVRFVSDASHELRTPISVIQGYANLLDRWGKKDEKALQESIDAIKTEAQNMKELVEKLLFLARGDNETIQLHKEVLDASELVDQIVREAQLIDKSHEFQMELTPAYINADRQLIKQAIRILVDNSIKYTPTGDEIILRVHDKDDSVHIVVQDNGIGIDAENLPHIFDRFYRSDQSRARETGGAGLGLSIAKWIIERHEGYFEVISRVNIGTRITIILPAAKKLDSDLQVQEEDENS